MNNKIKYGVIALFVLLSIYVVKADNSENMPSLTKADYGMSFVSWYGENSFSVAYGVTIYIDPVNIPDGQPKADAILITHPHPENFSLADISTILGGYTHIYGPAEVIDQIKSSDLKLGDDQLHVVAPFEDVVTGSYTFSTVPAYNTDKELHLQGSGWVGYIVTIYTPMGESKLYFSGDTSKIIEMDELRGKVDVAFISVNPEHGMSTVAEAVEAATVIGAEVAVPTGYSGLPGSDAEADQFAGMLSQIEGIDGIMMNKK